jgi:hypothetical protein
MGAVEQAFADCELAITIGLTVGHPLPTIAGAIDLGPEPVSKLLVDNPGKV